LDEDKKKLRNSFENSEGKNDMLMQTVCKQTIYGR